MDVLLFYSLILLLLVDFNYISLYEGSLTSFKTVSTTYDTYTEIDTLNKGIINSKFL